MLELLYGSVGTLYVLLFLVVYVYGINYVYIGWLAWRHRRARPPVPAGMQWPTVTVQIPLYNEPYVAERVIQAAAGLDYPTELLEIQVLDDSTDETVEIARNAVERFRAQGVRIRHLHRAHRTGFKAGALAAGLPEANGEYVAIFDADAVPAPDFLRQILPHFQHARVAFVQGRWTHLNRGYSLLTLLNSLIVDAEFMVLQFARYHSGYWFQFNGSAGVWRRSAIEDAGGWSADTLTEDMDLSYRAYLRGWHAVYVREIEVPTELPVSFTAFRRQQHRWARGNLECALRLLPNVWRARTALPIKLQATFHLTGFGAHVLLSALALLSPLVLLLPEGYASPSSVLSIGFAINLPTLAPVLFLIISQRPSGRGWWRRLPLLPLFILLSTSMMLNTVRAWAQVLRRRPGIFERTPKFGLTRETRGWALRHHRADFDPIVIFEFVLALLSLWSFVAGLRAGNHFVAILSAFFCQVLLFASVWTMAHTIVRSAWRLRSEVQPLADRAS